MDTKNDNKSSAKFYCIVCDYTTQRNSQYTRHLMTPKHKLATTETDLVRKSSTHYMCIKCNKLYKNRTGLWKHKKKCNEEIKNENIKNENIKNENIKNENTIVDENTNVNEHSMKNFILDIIKNNTDALKEMMEVCKNMNNTPHISNSINNNNTMTNSNNKTFNLQVFLNEQCKDAMNLSDFMESIQLSLEDLENMDKLGYVECMFKNIFGDMEFISIFDRPFHCSDFKRGIIYIKENGVWEKEEMGYTRLINAIRIVEKKNFKLLKEWTEKHPSFSDYNSPDNDKYVKLFGETMNGDKHNLAKLIRKLSKECVIDKSKL